MPNTWINHVFAVMALCPQHTFQVLTNRADHMAEYMACDQRHTMIIDQMRDYVPDVEAIRWPLSNVWLGVSVEDQKRADERIPHLLRCPAAVRFLSCEPLLSDSRPSLRDRHANPDCPSPDSVCPECGGDVACDGKVHEYRCVEIHGVRVGCGWSGDEPDPYEDKVGGVDLTRIDFDKWTAMNVLEGCGVNPRSPAQSIPNAWCPKIDWVIVGGESGRNARPCHLEHVLSIIEQCREAGVACFVKQLGSNPIGLDGKPLAMCDSHGGDWDEWPEQFRVRQWPVGA